MEPDRIKELGTEIKNNPGRREGQRILADEVTKIVHGQEGMMSAQRITKALFGGTLRALDERDLDQLSLDGMDRSSIGDQKNIVEAMAESGLARSRSDARKLLQSKGIQINGDPDDDPKYGLDRSKALFGKYHVVRRGKKTWHLLVHSAN